MAESPMFSQQCLFHVGVYEMCASVVVAIFLQNYKN